VSSVFVSTVRPLGSSLGVIIPSDVVKARHLRAGAQVRLSLVLPDYSLLDSLMGSMKRAKPFVRDRRDRV
jgi:antitoxin component of MazEF toxin-antitoxin module